MLGWLPPTRLQQLNGDHIRELRLMLEDHWRLSPHTVMHVLSDLRCFLRWASEREVARRSPFPPRVMPKIPEVAPRGFSEREIAILTSYSGRAGFALRFLLGTGLRWAEACRATRDHVRGVLLRSRQHQIRAPEARATERRAPGGDGGAGVSPHGALRRQ